MKKIVTLLSFLLPISTLIPLHSFSQGCSDAGVCTIHSIKNNAEAHETKPGNKNDISLGFAYGIGERSTNNYSSYVEYTRSLTRRTSLTGKFSYNFIAGELANVSGPGDLFLSINHAFDETRNWKKSIVVGLKVPFDKAAIEKNGIRLPMPYQTSLGTTDLVLALNYSRRSFGATLALQQPLKPENDNGFLPSDYPSIPAAARYWPTREFSRKGDIVSRLSYTLKTKTPFSFRPSLLAIYHETNDTYVDADKIRKEVEKSRGLTLNANLFVDYRLKNGNAVELSLGTPFVVRDRRPDGLTRKLVAAIEYQFSF